MQVRAKLKCQHIEGSMVNFQTQYDSKDTKEDQSFSAATPSGSVNLSVTNEDALKQFEVGAYYYFDITRVPEKTEEDNKQA